MGLTEIARQRIKNDFFETDRSISPKDALNYIEEGDHFRSLSSLIKDTMITVGVCSNDDEDSVFVKKLTEKLFQTEYECDSSIKEDSIRKRVDRWINGTTTSIEKADSVIEICFALDLDVEMTNNFLNRAGFCSLSIRRAEDAIYYYCLLFNEQSNGQKKTFADARKLIDSFYSAKTDESTDKDNAVLSLNTDSKGTTLLLHKALLNMSCETDEDFLQSFLLPNKKHFINYSKHSLFEYYKVKNLLFVTSILYRLRVFESAYIKDAIAIKQQGTEANIKNEECPIQFAFRSALSKYTDSQNNDPAYVFLHQLNSSMNYRNISAPGVYESNSVFNEIEYETYSFLLKVKKQIQSLVYSVENTESQKTFSRFLLDICSPMDLYKSTLQVLVKNGEMRSLGNKGAIKGRLIDEDSFSRFEKQPFIKSDRKLVDADRKMFILMYYLLFSYDVYYSRIEKDKKELVDDSKVFREPTIYGFTESLNKILEDCSFSHIYLPNQFDCLIVESVCKLETAIDASEYVDSPFDFVNEILSLILADVSKYWHRETWDDSYDESVEDWQDEDIIRDNDAWDKELNQILDDWANM